MTSRFQRLALIPAVLTGVLAIGTAAQADTVQTPLSSAVTVRGTSGGPQSSQCGFIGNTPNQVIQVTESATSLRFRVDGQGEPTLLITGPGNPICVMADSFSGGTIEVPGRLQQGNYSVFVGARSQGGGPFTLTITQD